MIITREHGSADADLPHQFEPDADTFGRLCAVCLDVEKAPLHLPVDPDRQAAIDGPPPRQHG